MFHTKSFIKKTNSLNKNIIEKKILNQLYYNKFLVRGEILNKKTKIIDNYSDYQFENDNNLNIGFSSNCFINFFKHKLNPIIRFKLKTYAFNYYSSSYVSSLEKSLSCALFSDNKFNSFYIIKPNKGGFICYSTGFCGFSPYTTIIHSLKSLNLSKTTNFFKNSKVQIFKFSFNSIKILLTPYSITFNFKKKKVKPNCFNLIFTLK